MSSTQTFSPLNDFTRVCGYHISRTVDYVSSGPPRAGERFRSASARDDEWPQTKRSRHVVIGSQHALCNAGTTWPPEKTDGNVLRENLLVELSESLILQLQRMLMTQQWRRLVVH